MKHNFPSLLLLCACLSGCSVTPNRRNLRGFDSLPAANALSSSTVRASENLVDELPANTLVQAPDEDDWRFLVAPYGWLLTVDGDATIDGMTGIIDEDFGDLLDKISFVLEARFEAWKGRWGAIADFTYARLESDAKVGPLKVDTTTDLVLGVLGGIHRFVDQELAPEGYGGVKVDGIVGIGITSIHADFDVSGGPDSDDDETWADPIFGMRSRWNFSPKWGGSIEALIGGFDLLDGSDLFTMFTALVGRSVGENAMLFFGWRSLDIDYDHSLELDVRISGPIVGLEFGF